ncbi:hypothetical protein HD806DRAFT_507418 [Xylariaceae sp. AK1471]|nr:hypothetical protein HD806DRAFT_507418 [Xylariaceae sp. AK1471]
MLVVTQRSECGASLLTPVSNYLERRCYPGNSLLIGLTCNRFSFTASGAEYVQANCDRQGDVLTCSSLLLWLGTKTV